MDAQGPSHFDSIQEHETPRHREKFVAKTFKRRSTNFENLQKTIQLLDDAVSPSTNAFTRTPRAGNLNLRHSTYTPGHVGTPSRLDNSDLYTFTSAKKKNIQHDHAISFRDPNTSHSVFKLQSNETVLSPFQSMLHDDGTKDLSFVGDEDHGKKVSFELFEAFKDSLKTLSGSPQVLDLVLEYQSVCNKYVSSLTDLAMKVTKNQSTFKKTVGLLEVLHGEKQTWQLVYSLFKDRLEEEARVETMDETLDSQMSKPSVWALSDRNIANKLYEKESSVRQSQLVVDWLEVCSYEGLDAQSDNAMYFKDGPVVWENTLHHLQKLRQRMQVVGDKSIVSEMDPDAPHRQKRSLDNIDESDERRLLRNLFTLLRVGRMDKASELCHTYGQPWRAASLEGWRLLHDPNYVESAVLDGNLHPVEGNAYRDVWKTVCWRMAKDSDLDQYERAMYASLSGNLEALLPVCMTWNDYVWAYFKVMVDIRVEQEVRLHRKTSRDLEDLPAEYYDKLMEPHEIFKEIEASIDEKVTLEAKTWYHVIQKHIILDDIGGLIENMYAWLQNDRDWLPSHLVRLMAHLVLFLRSIGHTENKDELCEAIVMAYVEDLINSNTNKNLVAFYVATLSPLSQVEWYARFLEGIEGDERRQCLTWAEDEGLDVAAITKMVVETIKNRDTASALPLDSLVPDLTISEEDAVKINSIDWLVFDETHRPEAIKQANSMLRCFIVMKKFAAARELFNKLPSDTIDVIYRLWRVQAGSDDLPPGEKNAIREYLCMKAYLDAVESFNDWFVLYHQGQPLKPSGDGGGSFTDRVAMEHKMKQYKQEHSRWMYNLQLQTKTSRDRIYNVLVFPDGGWLVDACEDPDADDLRQHQLEQLRSVHLPALCLNLHTILHSSGMHEEAVQIADVVASEIHQLYKVFDKDSLQQLLALLSKSSHSLLDAGKDPLGYEIV